LRKCSPNSMKCISLIEKQNPECRPPRDSIGRNSNTARDQYCAACGFPFLDALPRAHWEVCSRAEQDLEKQCFYKHLHHDRSVVGRYQLDRIILKSLVSQARCCDLSVLRKLIITTASKRSRMPRPSPRPSISYRTWALELSSISSSGHSCTACRHDGSLQGQASSVLSHHSPWHFSTRRGITGTSPSGHRSRHLSAMMFFSPSV